MNYDEKIISVDANDDDKNYMAFEKFIIEHSERDKNLKAKEIIDLGDDLLFEIDEKFAKQEQEKKKYYKYILRHSDKYTKNQLQSYSLNDVKDIFNELKLNNQSFIKKIFNFIFFNK